MGDDSKANFELNRRSLMAGVGGAGFAGAALLAEQAQAQTRKAAAPVKSLATAANGVTIKGVETFDVVVPQPAGSAGPELFGGATRGRINVTRVETNAGVRGYSFLGSTPEQVKAAIPVLVGKDLFAVDAHLKNGLIGWGAIEEAIWDAIGRLAGQPVAKLMGGVVDSVPVYVTYVWAGGANQTQVTPKEQGKQAVLLKQAGFKAAKIRIFRPDYNVDVEACSEILAAGGPGFRVMVDRTATQPGLWTYEQGLGAARALQKAGVYWLEEPFARDDYLSPARLRNEVEIMITGGEGYRGLEPYKQCLMHGTYETLQPELRSVAGIWTARKVAALAEAWGLKFAPHGTSGLAWAGRLQVSAAAGSLYQEIAVLTPPALPDDMCAPFLPLLHGEQPFKYRNGEALLPPGAGLGLNIDEAAINKYRVEGFETRRPPAAPTPAATPRT